MLAVLFGIKCKKKCSRSKIMPKKVLALSVRDYSVGKSRSAPEEASQQCPSARWLLGETNYFNPLETKSNVILVHPRETTFLNSNWCNWKDLVEQGLSFHVYSGRRHLISKLAAWHWKSIKWYVAGGRGQLQPFPTPQKNWGGGERCSPHVLVPKI